MDDRRLSAEMHRHNNVDKIIVTHRLNDARLHWAGRFQGHLRRIHNIQHICHVLHIQRHLNRRALHTGVNLRFVVTRFGAGGGDDGIGRL
jgi:hypothetical protein